MSNRVTPNLPFLFGEYERVEPKTFVLRLSKGIQTKKDLLSAYAEAGKFPDYFGHNWDALDELLRDLSWIAQPRILIVHQDLPLSQSKADLGIYLDILRIALRAAAIDRRELLICFPSNAQDELVRTFGQE